MLYFPNTIQLISWWTQIQSCVTRGIILKCKAEAWRRTSAPPFLCRCSCPRGFAEDLEHRRYACWSTSPEEPSAPILKYSRAQVRLDPSHTTKGSFRNCCRHWLRQNNCEPKISSKNSFKPVLNRLTVRYAPGSSSNSFPPTANLAYLAAVSWQCDGRQRAHQSCSQRVFSYSYPLFRFGDEWEDSRNEFPRRHT